MSFPGTAVGWLALVALLLTTASGCVVLSGAVQPAEIATITPPAETAPPAAGIGLPQPTADGSETAGPAVLTGIVTASRQVSGEAPAYEGGALPAPRPVPAGLTLDRIINTTLLADPKLRAGFELIKQAQGDAWTASLKPNPVLYLDTQLLPLTRPFTPTDQGGPPQTDVYLSYPIDWFLFGKRAAAMQAAALDVRSSEATFADLVRTRVLEAATAYYDVLEMTAMLDLARRVVKNYEKVEGITKKAVEGGGRPVVELQRVRLNLLASMQTMRTAEVNLVGARARLWALMGQGERAPAFALGGTLDTLPKLTPLPVEEALGVAQEQRPDIQALRWKVAAARAGVTVEDRKAYPDVTPTVGYSHQYQKTTIGFPDADSYLVGVTASLPFHNRNQGNRAKARAIVAQSQHDLHAGLVSLRAEVVQATKEVEIAAANARAVAEEQLELARQVRDSLNKAYEVGGRPLIDVLNAQQDYQQTFQLYITTRAAYGRAVMKYWATLGKKVNQ